MVDTFLFRPDWMAIAAKASLFQLEQQLVGLWKLALTSGYEPPAYQFLRSPEIGLAMVRGRAGGTGNPFNLGEMTITRCVIQFSSSSLPITGFGYVAGRSHRHAELAALCDALMQHPDWHDLTQTTVIEPLVAIADEKRSTEAAEVESTRVNFFTLLRGES